MKTGNCDAVRPPEKEILKYNECLKASKVQERLCLSEHQKKIREIIHYLCTAREILLTSFFRETVVRVPFISGYSLFSICSTFLHLCFSVKNYDIFEDFATLSASILFVCLFTLSSVKDRCFMSSTKVCSNLLLVYGSNIENLYLFFLK